MLPYLKLLRPKQWIKNGFVIAPIFFSRQFESLDSWALTLCAAFAFALAASCVYIINDVCDRAEDAAHPVKSLRPIAAGKIGVPAAMVVALACAVASVFLLSGLPGDCGMVLLAYVGFTLLYTLELKHHALVDVFMIASYFVMRVLMGCFALSVMVSPWIILTTFMLALFLGFGKRYHEMSVPFYAVQKKNLQRYSIELLDRLVIICGGAALVCYAIYTAETASEIGQTHIVYTVPFVAFGLFRYLQSIYVDGQGGEPESVILHDRWQWVTIGLWLLVTLWALG